MELSFFIFIFLSYGLAFLAADATIFGVSTQSFLEDPEDEEYIRTEGVFPFRRWLLRYNFFCKLFKCYFCMGVWSGAVAHVLLILYAYLNPKWRNSYFLWGPIDVWALVVGLIIAAIIGAVGSYLVDLVVVYLERPKN